MKVKDLITELQKQDGEADALIRIEFLNNKADWFNELTDVQSVHKQRNTVIIVCDSLSHGYWTQTTNTKTEKEEKPPVFAELYCGLFFWCLSVLALFGGFGLLIWGHDHGNLRAFGWGVFLLFIRLILFRSATIDPIKFFGLLAQREKGKPHDQKVN